MMHEVLAKIVTREAGKLLKMSEGQEAALSTESLESLEILARCAKALKLDAPPAGDAPSVPGDSTVEGDLELVGDG